MKRGTRSFRALTPEEFQDLALEQKLAYLSDAFKLLVDDGGTPFRKPASSPGTLGEVLYAGKSNATVSEREWEGLVQSVAAEDLHALHALYERAHRVVFTLAMRITEERQNAEELTVQVFHDVWRNASQYDASTKTVLGWIMDLARAKAHDRSRIKRGTKRLDARAGSAAFRPAPALQLRLARRIAGEEGAAPVLPAAQRWSEPEWEKVAAGISCKLLATDTVRDRVSMLVRLAPGAAYPPHVHAGVEELHLLHGELWIDRRKLYPGDYNRGEPGVDQRVWSETGCTCVLITSTRDTLISS